MERKVSLASKVLCTSSKNPVRIADSQLLDTYFLVTYTLSEARSFQSLSTAESGKTFTFYGYLEHRRDVSAVLSFGTLVNPERSHSIQLVSFKNDSSKNDSDGNWDEHTRFRSIPRHSPIAVTGILKARKNSPTPRGKQPIPIRVVELEVTSVHALNECPREIILESDTVFAPEQRHLQLRSSDVLQQAMALRSRVSHHLRDQLVSNGFTEVETPILFKSTPEGAREFLVPTRRKAMAYALVQSPQQYKQILMASGVHRYFQFARCFRDEDLRADRQPEFTQVCAFSRLEPC
jgi:aspartyl-tRNA synthetase